MTRHLLNLLATLSLALCLASAALWVWTFRDGRSLWVSSLWVDGSAFRDRRLSANAWDGRLLLTRWDGWYQPTRGREALFRQTWDQLWSGTRWLPERPSHAILFTNPDWSVAGVRFQQHTLGEGTSRHVQNALAVPLWIPALAFAIPPAWAAARRRRARAAARVARGQCPACAYDLTGNLSGVCPECGRATLQRSP